MVNVMTISDEEFAQLPDDFADMEDSEVATEQEEIVPEATDDVELETEEENVNEDAEEDTNERETEETGTEEKEDSTDSGTDESDSVEKDKTKAETETDTEATSEVDYKEVYEKVFAPFKANGVELQVKSPEDAIRLMQMGANYHQKMANLKPSLKTLKLLEKNDLLDETKLNFLIDLHNKHPEAINKLLQDSHIDPTELDLSEPVKYTPTQRQVNDSEFLLEATLEEIKDTPAYSKTLNVLTKVWDESSRNAILNAPQNIAVLNQHITEGLYDKVMGAVIYERSLGRLQGISDFDAYRQIGDALYAAGQLTPSVPSNPTIKTLSDNGVSKPTVTDVDRKKRKQAASPVKSTGTPAKKIPKNPLEMSDDEFLKVNWEEVLTQV